MLSLTVSVDSADVLGATESVDEAESVVLTDFLGVVLELLEFDANAPIRNKTAKTTNHFFL